MKIALLVLFSLLVRTSPAADKYEAEVQAVRKTLADLVKADTSNPPGNEARAVELVAARLKAEGVPYEIVEFAPGRSNLVARLKGSGGEKPLLLLAHLDVVGTGGQRWTSDPHALMEKDGYLVGRGVGDDLGMAAVSLEVFLMLKRSGVPLRRDVILALTGDEESGGKGIRHLLETKPQLVDAAVALNEGGGPLLGDNGKVKLVGLQTAEKTYQDFHLSTKGPTGHSSVPLGDNAIYRLARALDRLARLEMPVKLIPVTREYFAKRADMEPAKLAAAMRALASSKGTLPKGAVKELEKDPVLSANLRTTCIATMIHGGTKENALPPEAHGNVNCRILPGEPVESVRKRLKDAIADVNVEVTPVDDFGTADASPTAGEVPAAVQKVSAELWAGAPVIPMMSRGATDSRFLRMKGIASYGISPIATTEADGRRAHGIDERIPAASLRPGIEFFHKLVVELAGKAGGA